ncbi:MAG TPA: glutathione peroxidase [bacterium]|jgi:glutathione peroxidase
MKTLMAVMAMVALIAACSSAQPKQTTEAAPAVQGQSGSYLTIPFKTIAGDTADLAAYKGKVVLLVNVASQCGYTPQYKGLEALYRKYKDRGLVILGFPANNFGEQEPGTDAQILTFCKTTYDVTFPLMSKISVKGEGQHPLYTYLTKQSPAPGEITWNFNKFLLDRNGTVITRFDSKTTPEDPKLVAAIEKLLTEAQ